MSSLQPGSSVYSPTAWCSTDWWYGNVSNVASSWLRYRVQTLIVSKPLKTSSFVITSAVSELMRAAYFSATRSSQPVLRGRPVVVPNPPPRSRISVPISSSSSVGNGPAPTRVVYAFAMPQTSSMSRGPTPAPTHAAPATGFDDVTNG